MKKVIWGVAVLALVLSLTGCCCCCCSSRGETSSRVVRTINAGPVERKTYSITRDGVEGADVLLSFGNGELTLRAGQVDLMEGEFVYNVSELEPIVEYTTEENRGQLSVHPAQAEIRLDRFTEQVRNEWDIQLTKDVPLNLTLSVGDSNVQLDLGGLNLTSLDLTAGVADLQVRFDEPNPQTMDLFDVRTGASRLEFSQLGNAHFRSLTFDGGVGTYIFDLSGEWQHSAQVSIKAGASKITLYVPQDVGVRLCTGTLRGADYDGLNEQDGCYVNELYQISDLTLEIELDVGLSDLKVRPKR